MPVQYDGVLAEHAAVRQSVGLFDVSHLGRFDVTGPGATELVRYQLCNDVTTIAAGRAQYTMALNDRGGVVDDIIVWRHADDGYWVMPNGTNFDEILGRFADNTDTPTAVAAVRDETVLIAVQGPDSPGVVESVIGTMPGRFRVIDGEFGGGWFREAPRETLESTAGACAGEALGSCPMASPAR